MKAKAERSMADYEDMLDLPHHISPTRPQMTLLNRAAQFAPFAALTGYDELIDEADRPVERRVALNDEQQAAINERLRLLEKHLREKPVVSVVWFEPDARKQGGSYRTLSGTVRRLDAAGHRIIFDTGEELTMESLYSLRCHLPEDDLP